MSSTPRWEYKELKFGPGHQEMFGSGKYNADRMDEWINYQARQGWELAFVINGTGEHGQSQEVIAIFKKPTQ